MAKAKFQTFQREHPDGPLLGVTVVTKCECGWETTAQNSTLYGPPNALDLALLGHRISHLEHAQEQVEGDTERPVDTTSDDTFDKLEGRK